MSDKKILSYITRNTEKGKEVLVFREPENPKAGTQVPQTSLEDDAVKETVAMELAKKMSGLTDLVFGAPLGNTYFYDLSDDISYQRFFFHFLSKEERDEWALEIDGISYEFFWVPVVGATKKIYWGQAKFLNRA